MLDNLLLGGVIVIVEEGHAYTYNGLTGYFQCFSWGFADPIIIMNL